MMLKRLSTVLILASLLGYSGAGHSLDTDIYLEPPTVSREDAPNVLIIFDNSSSMAGNYVTAKAEYVPSTPYAYQGSGTAFAADKIYWKTNAQTAVPTSHTTYLNQWFLVSKNRCKSAGLPWHNNAITPLTGSTANVTVAMSPSNGTGDWTGITTDTTGVVDCKPDHDNEVADAETTGRKWLKKNSNGYTDTKSGSNGRFSWGGTAVTLYSGNYLNFLSQTTTSVSESRLVVARHVVKQVLDSNPGVNFGLMLFHRNIFSTDPQGGYVAMKIGKQTDLVGGVSRKDAIKAIVDAVRPRPFPYSEPSAADGGWSSHHVCNPANTPVPADCSDSTLALTGTPLAETLYEAKLYFAGETPKYGYPASPPTPAPDSNAKDADGKYDSPFEYTCQQAYIIYITDGNPWEVTGIDTDADTDIGNLSGIGTFNAAYTYGYSSRMDELARWMQNSDLVSDTILANKQRAITYTVGFGLNAGTVSTDPEKKNYDGTQLLRDAATNGGGKYYSAADSTELAGALQAALVEIQTQTSSFAAPALSVNAFNKLFNRDEVYFALFKPSTTQLWDGNVKKFKLCDTDDEGCEFGEVIDKNGIPAIDTVTQRIKDTAVSYWTTTADGGTVTAGGAGARIPTSSTRRVYTYRGAYSGLSASSPATLTQIAATSGNAIYDAAINDPSIVGLVDTSGSTTTTNAADTTEVTKLIKWLLGEDAYDKDQDGSSTDARWAHSDPLHSRPVAITFGGTSATPIIKLFYTSNDGVVRMVNDYNGQEEWAFVPNELLSGQYTNAQDAVGPHMYGMDGTATFWIRDNNNNGIIEPGDPTNDKVYMYVGMRRGGRNIYAFDVTPTAMLTDPDATGGLTPKLIWAIRGGVDNDYRKLAQTWSKPAVTRIRFGCSGATCGDDDSSAKSVLIFGGGYDPAEDEVMPVQANPTATAKMGNAIYIVDPETGARLWWASDGNDSAGNSPSLTLGAMKFSIPSDLALMDSNRDGEVDRIYVGDTGGQLWRIDLGVTLKANSNGNTTGFVFADVACPAGTRPNCSGTSNTARRKFFYPPDVAQVDDSQYEDAAESKYDLVAIATGDREDPLDQLTADSTPVNNRIYAFRDHHIDTYAVASPTPPTVPLTETDLYDATDNVLQDPNGGGYSSAISAIQAKKGWYIELKESGTAPADAPLTWPWVGEKGLARPTIFNGVLFVTTYTPANDLTAATTCSASEGLAKLHAMNHLNGTAAIDFNNSGSLTTNDRAHVLGGGIPSETVIVIREGGVTSLVGTSGGAARPKINSKLPRFKTFWYEE